MVIPAAVLSSCAGFWTLDAPRGNSRAEHYTILIICHWDALTKMAGPKSFRYWLVCDALTTTAMIVFHVCRYDCTQNEQTKEGDDGEKFDRHFSFLLNHRLALMS